MNFLSYRDFLEFFSIFYEFTSIYLEFNSLKKYFYISRADRAADVAQTK